MSSNLKVNTILPSTGTAIGIGTASGNVDVLGHIVGHNTPNISGINSVTANTFYGSGANLTGITGTTINNNANNRIITGSGTANTLNANSTVTWDGTQFIIRSSDAITSYNGSKALTVQGGDAAGEYVNLAFNGNGYQLGVISGYTNATSNNGAGSLIFSTNNSGSINSRLVINQNGHTHPSSNNTYDLGTSSYRWRNLYSVDVNVSSSIALLASSGNNPTIDNADGGQKRSLYFKTGGSARLIIQEDGHTRPASNNTFDLGTSGDRWRNIYTNDLNLSNKGSTNCVDNTWGDYTIQEGESDLFLINNRNGKKYKFNLTEVS